ncbi:MAG: hypothetical protein HY904_13115 [Deltaproteobacteria bacterium]|nr:hypothetical protein [Deltaproteobacteria bacterium]
MTFTACTSPHSVTVGPGLHTFNVRAAAGGLTGAPASFVWSVDLTAPQTSIDTHPAATTNLTLATFTFSSSETPVTFQCRLDSGPFGACSSGSASYTGLAAGSHQFTVVATDASGNADTNPPTFTWTIDLTPPVTTILTHPADPTSQQGATFTFSAEAGSTFTCQLDTGAAAPCTSPMVYADVGGAGSHTFRVLATDAAGNPEVSASTFTWQVDLSGPSTTITSQPANPTALITASFSFSSTKPGTFTCQLDSGAATACTSPQDYTGLAEGSHTFLVTATDTAGNVELAPPSVTWTVDTSFPTTTIQSGPAAGSTTNQASATFTFSCDGESLACSFMCQLDAQPAVDCSTGTETYAGLSNGAHTFSVQATDAAANPALAAATRTWTVDTVRPTTTITGGPSAGSTVNATSATFNFTCSKAPCTFQCTLDSGTAAACDSGTVTYNGLSSALHAVTIVATDAIGNVETPATTRNWTVDTVRPTTTLTSGPAAGSTTNATSATFNFTCSKAPCTFQCTLDSGTAAACDGGTVTYNGLSSALHTVTIVATDAIGNVESPATTRNWTVDAVPPVTTITNGPAAGSTTTSTTAVFTFTCNKSPCTFQCTLDSGAAAACNGGTVSYGSLSSASHTVTVVATDALGNVESPAAARTWTVDTTPPTTTISGAPADPFNQATASFTLSCNESGCTYECDLDGGGFSSCTSPVSYTSLAEGSHTFSVRATDPMAHVESPAATYTWMIDRTPADTVILTGPALDAFASPVTFTFSSPDAAASFTCRMDGGAFAACTSGQSFTVSNTASHRFEVASVDAAGNQDPSPDAWTFTNAWQAASLSHGAMHQCAVTLTGTAKCWGAGYVGQLGNKDTRLLSAVPDEVALGGATVTRVATGGGIMGNAASYSCALTSTGGVKCWGSFAGGATPTDVTGLTSGVSAITVGAGHACALMTATGGVKCWGNNANGQLGDTSTSFSAAPVDVTGLTSGVTAVEAGANHTCAIVAGDVMCWGANGSGQLGTGGTLEEHQPAALAVSLSGVVQLSLGALHSCARTAGGGLKCWGANFSGQVGDGTQGDALQPTDVSGLTSGALQVSAGTYHTCAVVTGNTIKCWGGNASGQLGDPSLLDVLVPQAVPGVASAQEVAAGGGDLYETGYTVVRLAGGGLVVLGENVWGTAGTGTAGTKSTVHAVAGAGGAVSAVSPGTYHGCAVAAGAAQCWGKNDRGQLGNGSTRASPSLVSVSTLDSGVTSVAAGLAHSCAVQSGAARCWGAGYALGDNVGAPSATPVSVFGLGSGVASVVAGDNHACALLSSGEVRCWGAGTDGQLGDGAQADSLVPVAVTGIGANATSVAAGGAFTCAVVSGAVTCWGRGTSGQLGDGNGTSSVLPVPVSGLTTGWVAVTAGSSHACARSATEVRCWGAGSNGQLGDGLRTGHNAPVVVSGFAGVTLVSAGGRATCGMLASGAVWCTGDNYYGTFMDGGSGGGNAPVPSRVSLVSVLALGRGQQACVVIGGTLSCAGEGSHGRLGDGTAFFTTPQPVLGMP